MTTIIDKLKIILEVVSKGAKASLKVIDKSLGTVTKTLRNAKAQADKFNTGFRMMNRAMLGIGLSMLFTGMAIKRFFQGMLTSMLQTFLAVEGEGGAMNNTLGELMAAIEFLKYTLIDAAAQTGVFDKWIERINKLVDWFTNLDEETQASIVNFMVWGVIIGTVMMVVGQALLGLIPILLLIQMGAWPIIAVFLILGLAIALIWMIAKSNLHPLWKLLLIIAVVVGSLVLIFLILGIAITAPILIAIIVIGVVIAALVLLSQKVGGVGNAFKAMGVFILRILAFVADGIVLAIITPLNFVIDMINTVIRASNRFLGTAIQEIPRIQFKTFGSSVDAMRDKLLAEGAEGKKEVNNTVVVEGNTDESFLDKIMNFFQNQEFFNQGSPQTGGE